MSKIVSNQIVPRGWLSVIKPGNCYEPYEKDAEIITIMLQIYVILLFVPFNNSLKVIIKNILRLRVIINTENNDESKTHQVPTVI